MSWLPLEDFGKGLNLVSGPLDPSHAIDALDVTYGRAIRSRAGWGFLTPTTNTYTKLHAWKNTSGAKYLLAGRSGNTDALDNAGATAYTTAKTFTDAVSFGSPGSECAYLANGSDTVFKFTGSAFSSPANQPKAKYLAILSPDNRLVATGFTAGSNGPSGSTVSESTVHFSDEGAPETWTANNYVHLTPGDGEKITGITSWRNLVFVFKESKFFVFSPPVTGADGNPIFDYREVSGAGLIAPNAIATSPDGVYFLSSDGIYVTNGGNPSLLLGQEMGPIFSPLAPDTFTSGVVNMTTIAGSAATFHEGRAYFAVPMGGSSTNNRIIVYDASFGWWSIYSIPANDLTVWNPSSTKDIVFAHPTGGVGVHSNAYIADNAVRIPAFSRQAWLDVGQQMSVRQIKLWGAGVLSTAVATDYGSAPGVAVSSTLLSDDVVWGDGVGDDPWGDGSSGSWLWGPSSPTIHKTIRGLGARGFLFSIKFTNESSAYPMVIEQASLNLLGGVNKEQ